MTETDEVSTLRAENAILKQENAKLRARNAELEPMASRYAALDAENRRLIDQVQKSSPSQPRGLPFRQVKFNPPGTV